MDEQTIRPECLRAYGDDWVAPTGDEVREVLRRAGLSGRTAALLLGLGSSGGRTVRRWCAEKPPVPYAAWAILCDAASLGRIWR
jgi:hypothetical protein